MHSAIARRLFAAFIEVDCTYCFSALQQVDTQVRQHSQTVRLLVRRPFLQGLFDTRENHAAGEALGRLRLDTGCLATIDTTCLAVAQVYVALCRLSQVVEPSAREAVRKAIDIMIPNLARAAAVEASPSAAGQGGASAVEAADSVISKDSATSGQAAATIVSAPAGPSYARYLKRMLSEEGHVLQTLSHLLQIIVRNRDMFYQTR